MYLWAARSQATRGMGKEAVDYLAENRELVSSITGLPFWTWAAAAGEPLGTYYTSSRVQSFDQYMTANMAVNQSADWHALTKKGIDLFDGPVETQMSEVVAMGGELREEPYPLIVVTQAHTAPGRQGAGIAWGADMVQLLAHISGSPAMFTTDRVGTISAVNIVHSFESPTHMDESTGKLFSDASYGELLARGGDLFMAGSARRVVLARLP